MNLSGVRLAIMGLASLGVGGTGVYYIFRVGHVEQEAQYKQMVALDECINSGTNLSDMLKESQRKYTLNEFLQDPDKESYARMTDEIDHLDRVLLVLERERQSPKYKAVEQQRRKEFLQLAPGVGMYLVGATGVVMSLSCLSSKRKKE